MSQTSAQNRERAVKAITQRNMLQRRIKRTQRQMEAAQGEVRQSLQDSVAADQAAMAELTPTLEQIKADMCQEEASVRRKTQETLSALADLRANQSLHHFPGGSDQWGPSQTFALVVIFGALAAMLAVLLLNRE